MIAREAEAAPIGQVFTPVALADLTVALALDGLSPARRVLDPACGDGVFLERALAAGVPATGVHGVEIHGATAAAARARAPRAHVERGDFLAAPPPATPFDAVIGNPPYVRQEALGAARKHAIAARVAADWGVDWPARADLAAAFVARALRFVRPGGRVAFVLSTAALDAGYGGALREFLNGRAHLLAVVASACERWFERADIHAAVVVLERAGERTAPAARFAQLRVPLQDTNLRCLDDLDTVADVRRVAPAELDAMSWSARLRAPAELDAVLAAAGDAIVPLTEIAELWRGSTSGANQFFYLSRAAAAAARIEPRFLCPLLKSPRDATTMRIEPGALATLAFVCDLDARALARHPGAAAWVRRHAALAARPSLATRARWWSMPARPAQVFLTKAYDERFVQRFSPAPLLADQRVYALAAADPELLAAVLNGTLTALALEGLGRASMGQGALEWAVGDAHRLPILDPRRLDGARVRRAFRALSTRPVGALAAELAAPDRRALDDALLAGAPAALRKLLPAARAALARSVAARLSRSR